MKITKSIITDKYAILFDGTTGFEISSGINKNPDPFILNSPSMIDIGIMGHCSNNCEICYQGNYHEPNMTLDNFKIIIDQCKSHINQVALGGKGDPNKHENFKEILEYCIKNNVIPNYTTSGNGITNEEIEISKLCGSVAVSSYDKDFTYEAINKFINSNIKKINIHFVVTSETIENAIKIIKGEDIWKGKFPIEKINAVIFLLFKPQGNGANKTNLCPTNTQFEEFSELLKTPLSKIKIGCDSCLINKIMQIRELTENEKLFADSCEGSRMSCYISSDMRFMPCSFGDKIKYGIPISRMNTIQEIWNNGWSFKMFRETLEKNPASCPYEL